MTFRGKSFPPRALSGYALRITDYGYAVFAVFAAFAIMASVTSGGEAADPCAKFRIEPEPPPPADPYVSPPWLAHWIWSPGEPKELDRFFRRTLDLPERPREACVTVTADDAFELYVNGRFVGQGYDWHALKEFDLARWLRKGRNVLAVKVHNDAPGDAGLLLQGDLVLPGKAHVQLFTEASWRVAKTAPEGWTSPDFDDKGWAPATSLGKHPCLPWATPATTTPLSYHGPRYRLKLHEALVRQTVRPDEKLALKLTLTALDKFPPNVPFVVELGRPGERPARMGIVYPKPPSDQWPVDELVETSDLLVELPHALFLAPGPYDVYLRPTAAVYVNRPTSLVGTTLISPHESDPTRAGQVGPLDLQKAGLNGGTYIDSKGWRHLWHLTDRGSLRFDGDEMIPVDGSDGVYYCETAVPEALRPALDELRSPATLREIARSGFGELPVRCKLVDTIDCVKADRSYSDDAGRGGTSRVLKINGRDFRVTDARKATSYFALTAYVQNRYRPHLLVFETPNDIERYTFVRIQPPWDNVGGGVYTGRELPLDGKPTKQMFLFYPHERSFRFTVSRIPAERTLRPESGAAVSRVWILELLDDLLDGAPDLFTEHGGTQRRFGLACNQPVHLYTLYGRDDRRDPAEHRVALLRFLDYLRFVVMNHLEVNAINGSDVTEAAHYPSALFPQAESIDLFRDLLPLTDRAGVSVVPSIAPLALEHFEGQPWLKPEVFQTDRDGKSVRECIQGHRTPDPLHPDVQKVLLDGLREMGRLCRRHGSVVGLGFRVDGRLGTCYAGYDDQAPSQFAGYSSWDIAQFCRDAGLNPQTLKPTPYAWIAVNAWIEWMDWRCKRTRDFWLKARSVVRSGRPDWNLVVRTALPSPTPGRNLQWVGGSEPRDLLRHHGYDPALFARERGLVIQQGLLLDGDRYAGGPAASLAAKSDAWAYKAFDFLPGLSALFKTGAPSSAELHHVYWEESGIWPKGEFQTELWGAGTAYPIGRYFFQPLTHALRTSNARDLVLFSWERGSFGHEHDLRAFARCFRALPHAAPREYRGLLWERLYRAWDPKNAPAPERDAAGREWPLLPDGELWVRWFGSRLAVLNDSPHERLVTLHWPRELMPGQRLVDLATMRTLVAVTRPEPDPTATFFLRPYELHTLLVLPRPAPLGSR